MELQTIEPGHDRAKYLGGSDIAAVLGLSPWRTPVQLWKDKTTPRVEGPVSNVKKRGIRWESVVSEMLVERLVELGYTVEVVAANKRYKDPVYPWMASEIDFEVKLNGSDEITNVELKTVHPFKTKEWGDSGSDDLPVWYTAQAMWGLGITGRAGCFVAALFGADELRVFPVAADPETILGMRDRAVNFWVNHVQTGVAPDPTLIGDLDILFPTDSEKNQLLADEELAQRVLRLRAINIELKAREAEYDALEFEIRRTMQDCTQIIMPNGKLAVEWKNKSGSWFDETACKEADPKMAKLYTRKWEKRVFTLKAFDAKGI